MKKVLFAASEAVPFIKTGGLADVVGSLPKCFDRTKYEVRVILPKYMCIKDDWKEKMTYITHFNVALNWRNQYVGIFEYEYDGVLFWFIDNEFYFSGNSPYSDLYGDLEKFAYFSKAVLAVLPVLGFKPDVIHCHDWQTGLIPVFLDQLRKDQDFFRDIKTVFTIHNLKFQGTASSDHIMDITGLPGDYFSADKLVSYRDANYLKGGVVYADAVTTVSLSYAEEIKTPFYGECLDGLMRARENALYGIVNGIDYVDFDPEKDTRIAYTYTPASFRWNKYKNKLALQEELSLTVDKNKMMIGIVSRLTGQKGIDLIQCVLDELIQDDIQLVVLGTGEEQYENMFRHFAWKYPEKVAAMLCYNEALSHKIYAACDAFLMPSLFEPCGLSQLISLRYGTVPIVRETGGLRDTVEPYNEYEKTGTGFSFANYNAHEMMAAVRYAEKIYYKKKAEWNKIAERAMNKDYSWEHSAGKYEALYDRLCEL